MTLDELNLSTVMAQRATELLAAFPSVEYLSGRRDLQGQAHAMACQVVTNRRWISQTYLHAATLQSAVDSHPDCSTVPALESLLYNTLLDMSEDEQNQVSDHLTGHAVDLVPMEDGEGHLTPTGEGVYTWIHDCPDTKKFLLREGGKVIWHWAITARTDSSTNV
jgi:hypothetical protein